MLCKEVGIGKKKAYTLAKISNIFGVKTSQWLVVSIPKSIPYFLKKSVIYGSIQKLSFMNLLRNRSTSVSSVVKCRESAVKCRIKSVTIIQNRSIFEDWRDTSFTWRYWLNNTKRDGRSRRSDTKCLKKERHMILFLISLYILKMIVFYWIAKRILRWRKKRRK